jgi:sugar porter (SP) family MFS transporter
VVSGSLGGALLGSVLAYLIADPLGRRKELLSAAALYLIGALLMAFAPSLPALVAGRVAYGLGIGLAMHGAPMYIAETAPSKVRGTLISLKEAFIVGGILLGYLGGYFEIGEVGGWRWMYGLSAPAAVVMAAGMLWLPESPRWLLLRAVDEKGDPSQLKAEARTCIKRLRGRRATDANADAQVGGIVDALNADKGEDLGDDAWKELLTGPNVKALTIGTGLVFFQQVTGQPSVLYYAATIFKEAGFAEASEATKISVFLGSLKLAATMLSVVIVDKAGRRPLLLAGVSGISASLLALAAYYSSGQSVPIASVVALLVYVGCYQVSFGPISWLMVSEIFPLRVRGRALSLATLVNFGSNALVSFALPTIQEDLGQAGTFFTFFVIALVSLAFIYFQVPETKGLSLEEIEEQLSKN